MVDKVNEFIKSSNQLTAYNQETGVAATLQGDSLARNLKSGLNRVLGQQDDTISGSYNSLISIGLSVDQNGIYSFDSGKLTEALDSEDNYDSIISMINGDDGFAKNIKTYVDSFVSGDGVLTSKSDSLQQSLKEVDASRESLELRLEKLEKRYRDQFGAMDALVATLQAESNFLLQGLANLPGFTRDKD
jgi:flagellar hook-associated protein 2